ncbi:MAG: serine hydrolase [Eubacteriales bacterium]
MAGIKKISIERANFPEEAGVSSNVVADFIEDLKKSNIETHSIMILRHGKVAFESWSEPYEPDIPHTMYSVSKSFTSTAIGFAIEESLLSLQTRVIDMFPEFKPKKKDENLEKLTVFHLLTMTAGKNVSLLADKTKNRWIQDFFDAKWAFAPGESWFYISENTYILSEILTRVTRMSLTEYLTPRLYEPLGFGRVPFWEKNGNGVEAGGWGLFITTEELAKFMLCYSQGGVFNGKQVIPAKWARDAVEKQVENHQYTELANTSGYGYCIWRNPMDDSYRADGFFSQFGAVFEKYDALLVMTAAEIDEEKSRDCIWRHFPKAFFDERTESNIITAPEVKPALKPLPDLPALPRSGLETKISGKTLKIKTNRFLHLMGFPMSMLNLAVIYMSAEKAGNIDDVKFEFSENECSMSWGEGKYKNTIICGMDGKTRKSQIRLAGFDLTASSTAAWESENTLNVWMRPLESLGQRRMRFVFNGKNVKIYPSSCPDTQEMLNSLSDGVGLFIKLPALVVILKAALQRAGRIIEPKHRGRIKMQ